MFSLWLLKFGTAHHALILTCLRHFPFPFVVLPFYPSSLFFPIFSFSSALFILSFIPLLSSLYLPFSLAHPIFSLILSFIPIPFVPFHNPSIVFLSLHLFCPRQLQFFSSFLTSPFMPIPPFFSPYIFFPCNC